MMNCVLLLLLLTFSFFVVVFFSGYNAQSLIFCLLEFHLFLFAFYLLFLFI